MKEELQATFLKEEKQKVFGDKFACWSCTSLKKDFRWGGPTATEQEKR